MPGERIYAIGDVHGRYDLLQKLLRSVISHWENAVINPKKVSVLLLGDIIDRGPDSAKCVRAIRRLVEAGSAKLLLGNHEDMLLASAYGNAAAQKAWLLNGGAETLKSFDIAPPAPNEDPIEFGKRLKKGLGEGTVEFLGELKTAYRSGDYLFVHAGIRPGVPLEAQQREDLIWIRDEFTSSNEWHGAAVVHGHSCVESVEIRHNRIACDTAAYQSGRLSCICLQDDLQTVITT